MNRRTAIGILLALLGTATLLPGAYADDHDQRHGDRDGRDGYVREQGGHSGFRVADDDDWRRGRWTHEWHDGRLGWWWVAGSAWLLYNATEHAYPPVYVPPTVIVQSPPPVQAPAPAYWYYCPASRAYYPYVQSCAAGWQTVPAAPPPDAPAPPR